MERTTITLTWNDSTYFNVDQSCPPNGPVISKIEQDKRIEQRGQGWGRGRDRGRGGRGRKETIKEKIEWNK